MINKYKQRSFLPNNHSKRVKDKDDDNTVLSKIITFLRRNSNRKIKDKMDDIVLYEKQYHRFCEF